MRNAGFWASALSGCASVLLGIGQLAWVCWVIGDASLHMGSLLRMEGPYLLHAIDDQHLKMAATVVYENGLNGFKLLGDSLLLHCIAAAVAIGSGAVLLLLARGIAKGRIVLQAA